MMVPHLGRREEGREEEEEDVKPPLPLIPSPLSLHVIGSSPSLAKRGRGEKSDRSFPSPSV